MFGVLVALLFVATNAQGKDESDRTLWNYPHPILSLVNVVSELLKP